MANLVLAGVTVALVLTSITALARSWLSVAGTNVDSVLAAARLDGRINRTELSRLVACETPLGSAIQFAFSNEGQTSLRDFPGWDLIAFYESDGVDRVQRLAYTDSATPSSNEWTVSQILLPNGQAEVFDPGIVNPGEEATVLANLSPAVWASVANKLVLATDTGTSLNVTLTGENACGFYLHNFPTPPSGDTASQAGLPANSTYPGQPALYNYDSDRDARTGLLIAKGGAGPDEADLTKYQNWWTAPLTEDFALAGTVTLDVWAAVKDFNSTLAGQVSVYLRDYDGLAYTEIASSTVTADPWDAAASGTYVKRTIQLTGLNHTVVSGNRLEVKIEVGPGAGDDMWLAYDTSSYPAVITFPAPLRLLMHSEQRRVSTTTYYTLSDATHQGGFYLHNNPTPPVADTAAQANLTASRTYPGAGTLYNYDTDLDAVAGRLIARGGSGAGETDLTKYQNWLTAALDGDLEIKGLVQVELWSAMQAFDTAAAGEITVYLRDYDGASYTEIASTTLLADPWDSTASGTWVKKVIEISGVDYTIPAGNSLEAKVTVGGGAATGMLFAYDSADYPSQVKLWSQTEPHPAGLPVTLTASAGAGTGRLRPTPNQGRFLLPLDGYTEISDSTWAVTYRVKRQESYGFIWFTNATDITPGVIDQWTDIDLSALVPVGAAGAVVEVVNNHPSSALSAVARGKADTRDYMPTTASQKLVGRGHRWQVVKVDANRLIQGYVEDAANVSIKLLGYTIGDDPVYPDTPPDITPATTGAWTSVSVSSYVDSDADGVILMIDSVGNDTEYAVREVGSADADISNVINGQGNSVYFVGIDGSDNFAAYLATADVNIYLLAQTKGSVGYYSNDIAVTDPSTGSWQSLDADDYSVPAAATGLVFRAENAQNKRNNIGFRHGDSTDDWNKQLWSLGHMQAAVGINDANVWGELMGSANVDVQIAAYTTALIPDYDVHADLDALIRKSNGVIRTTLATDVATTTDVTTGVWTTYTGTFTPTSYQVADPSDYLEIDLFADFTRNAGASATLDFRIDDNALAAADQTSVANVALVRE